MKIVSWNVNGIRACLKKGFTDFFEREDADIFCVQETKAHKEQVGIDLGGQYIEFWNSAEKKGYSGTAVFTKLRPQTVTYGLDIPEHDNEGRVITLEYEGFYLVTVYTPNSQRELTRIDYRMRWEDAFRGYVCSLSALKPVIICGDLNVAHTEKDIYNAKSNINNAGFTMQEREKMTQLLGSGFIDFYRHFNPDKTGDYTWWSYIGNSREKNHGWRIDYFLGTKDLTERVKDVIMLPGVHGSDHCPIRLTINNQ